MQTKIIGIFKQNENSNFNVNNWFTATGDYSMTMECYPKRGG